MSEHVPVSANALQSDTKELMQPSHFSDSSVHAERVHTVAWSGPPELPACSAEISLVPDTLCTAGKLADRLPDAGVFVFLLALSVVIVRMSRVFVAKQAVCEEAVSIRAGKMSRAPFASSEMAVCASDHENTRYWQHLLIAFAAALEGEGYALSTDSRSKVTLPFDTRTLAGTAIVKARCRYLAPLQSAEGIEQFLAQSAEDGYAGNWADWCQRGAEAAGWYVVRGSYIDPKDGRATATSLQTK